MANINPPTGKRFQKGNKANPRGAGAHNPVVKAIRKMTQDELAEVLQVILEGNLTRLMEIKDNPESSVLKVWIVSIAVTAIKKGDATAFNALLDRLVGRVKDKVEHEGGQTIRVIIDDYTRKLGSDGA